MTGRARRQQRRRRRDARAAYKWYRLTDAERFVWRLRGGECFEWRGGRVRPRRMAAIERRERTGQPSFLPGFRWYPVPNRAAWRTPAAGAIRPV